jgi:hypothetical protein
MVFFTSNIEMRSIHEISPSLHDGRYDGYSRHFEILRIAMNEKSHEKLVIQNTKVAKGIMKVTKETDAAVSVVDGVLQKQH